MLTPGADPVRKISIVPRGHALGVTFQSPDADRYSYSASYLRGRIAGMLAGRAAEELVYGDVTTEAGNDLEQATGLAKQMVGRWGMSEVVGMMTVLPDPRREQPLTLGGDGTSATGSWSRPRPGASSTRATTRPWRPCGTTAGGSTTWSRPCCGPRPWTLPTPTGPLASPTGPSLPRASPRPRGGAALAAPEEAVVDHRLDAAEDRLPGFVTMALRVAGPSRGKLKLRLPVATRRSAWSWNLGRPTR